ncbi:MAG: MarR family transcriptional regulator [bacterium]|nr:MarR family transcriptional regulator [bacterium]
MVARANRTPSGEALTRLILQSFQLHGLLGAAGDELTEPWGLSSAKWKVLGATAEAGQPLHVAQIGRNMGLTRQGVQRTVNDLEKAGLVQLVENPDHRRARLVQLTRRGQKVFDEVMAKQVRWSNKLADGINERTIRSALGVMATLSERLKEQKNENQT